MNSIFGYQIESPDRPSKIAFDGALPVDVLPIPGTIDPQIRLFASSQTQLQSVYVEQISAYAHVWGIPVHPEIKPSDIPAWCACAAARQRFDHFKELIGPFVVIIDEPLQHRITLVTDILGVRPMFVGSHHGRIIFGSEVWPLQSAGLTKGGIDYDAVSAWITYGYNCTQGSLFSDIRRVSAGCATVFQQGQFTRIPYATFSTRFDTASPETVADELHETVASTMRTMLANFCPVVIALSGGFDSRYLAALAAGFVPKSSIQCYTVGVSAGETTAATRVAQALGLNQKVFPVDGSEWDIYTDVYHFMADGFPISKSVTDYVARQQCGVPMINGFMGDSLMRGSHDRIDGKYESECAGDLADVLQRRHQMLGPKILRRDVAAKIQTRSRVPMERAIQEAVPGKVFAWVDYYYRQRHYISINFLQHLGQSEALLPFYSWPLLSYKMEHDSSLFDWTIYRRIFDTYFPSLSAIPHASDIPDNPSGGVKIARCARTWAQTHLPRLARKRCLSLIDRKFAAVVVVAGLAGNIRAENYIFTLRRLSMLEDRVREADLNFDWEAI